jgi:predicted HTH transcriptional regulator
MVNFLTEAKMQLDLLDVPSPYNGRTGFKTGGASQEAAAMVDANGSAVTIRIAALRYLQAGKVETAEQIAKAINRNLHSTRSRLTKLMECGLIEKLEERGQGESGVRIHKWRCI